MPDTIDLAGGLVGLPHSPFKDWDVELNGVLQPGEVMSFFPDVPGGHSGTWVNFDANQVWGFGTYQWDPVLGHLDYQNASGDGGGGHVGTYSWDGVAYVRTYSSHPKAPPMVLR